MARPLKKNTKTVFVRLPAVLDTPLRAEAAKRGYELSELIREIIRDHYDRASKAKV